MPRSFYENTSKEELVIEHVLEYERQFRVIYDPLRKLLLLPKNELGKQKFICTTIRKTKLPYVDLYQWDRCAKFISDYIEYEELEYADQYPDTIPAPSNVLEWQQGDAFDMSIVLCSLLLGAGYDAYVMMGTAPKYITTRDESKMEIPFSLEIDDNEDRDDPNIDVEEAKMIIPKKNEIIPVEGFQVKQEENPVSTFDAQIEKRQKEAKHKQFIADTVIDDDEPDYEKDDPYGRTRKHCWIYIDKGKRDMTESFFIEPSTGRRYFIDDCPYFTIEAVFNDKNYWINMDPTKDVRDVNLEFQEDTTGEWEYVMVKTDDKKHHDDEENGEDEELGENADDKAEEE